ncbi:hypothetical protein E3U23_06160 [Erythrobacter litoralis]|uniref:hypothetical protein n=1 Tax=Erythrobacter litoralis TaxID=39960 RepID=UPI002434DF0F|nr:hypothetical protein [Erythrobacter litoralis]MDG6078776.1 hypothetical protein [Erythrobacter litoralis]
MRSVVLAAAIWALAACGSSDQTSNMTVAGTELPEQPTTPPKGRLAPRNECIELPGAKEFFVSLEKAIKDRNADALLGITAPGVRLDFGAGGGLTAFRERLEASDSQLWAELDRIVALGCAVDDGGNMVLPWYFAQDLKVDDPFAAMIVTGSDVPVLSEPNAIASPIERISWDTVTAVDGPPKNGFAQVRTTSGGEGFVAADKLRSLVDYRLYVSGQNGNWHITSFVSGD